MRIVPVLTLCGLLASPVAGAGAPGPDALEQCARIDRISVPEELHADADLIVYAPRSGPRLTVSGQAIELGGRRFQGATVAPYHAALRAFLAESGRAATVTRSMLNRGRYAQVAADTCRRILALHAAGAAVEQRFAGFVSPVRIRLK